MLSAIGIRKEQKHQNNEQWYPLLSNLSEDIVIDLAILFSKLQKKQFIKWIRINLIIFY